MLERIEAVAWWHGMVGGLRVGDVFFFGAIRGFLGDAVRLCAGETDLPWRKHGFYTDFTPCDS